MNLSVIFLDRKLSTRTAAENDEPFLFQIFREVRGNLFALLPLTEEQFIPLLESQYRSQRLGYKARYPGASVEIISFDGVSIGQLIHVETSDHHCLVDISIQSEFQNRGIGSRIVRELIHHARTAGLPLLAHVANDNPGARDLWLRTGFRVIGADEVYTKLEFTPDQPSIPGGN